MRPVKNRLRGRGGFTLTELLVVTILVSMLSAMGLMGINAALRCRDDAIRIADAQTLGSTALEVISDELRFTRDPVPATAGGALFTVNSKFYGTGYIQLTNTSGTESKGQLTICGKKALPEKTYANNLTLADLTFTKDTTNKTVTVTVKVKDPKDNVVWTGAVTVCPLNGFAT